MSWLLIFASGSALCLVAYGVVLAPAVSRLGIGAAVTVLSGYAAIGRWVVPRLSARYPAVVQAAGWAGLAAGAVFSSEICLEYVLLPKDNTPWGMAEFGAVFFIYTCAGIWIAATGRKIKEAVMASALSAVVSSIIWCVFVLATFYLFYGTDRQKAVFLAEGDYEDFRQSGMTDFKVFITEDFFGATFFHLILGPLFGGVLGLAGYGIGKGLAAIRKRFTRGV